jgi:hypothetical protein
VSGIVTRLLLDPEAGVIEITIADGVGSLVAQWPISRPAWQLEAVPGSRVVLEGVPRIDPRRKFVMEEPTLEVISVSTYE